MAFHSMMIALAWMEAGYTHVEVERSCRQAAVRLQRCGLLSWGGGPLWFVFLYVVTCCLTRLCCYHPHTGVGG